MFALRRIAKFGPQREPIRILLFIGDQFSTVQLYNNNKYSSFCRTIVKSKGSNDKFNTFAL